MTASTELVAQTLLSLLARADSDELEILRLHMDRVRLFAGARVMHPKKAISPEFPESLLASVRD